MGGVDGLSDVASVTVSPDGKNLYVAGVFDSAVAVFSRDSTTGTHYHADADRHCAARTSGLADTHARGR